MSNAQAFPPYSDIALQFARSLSTAAYSDAHTCLAAELQRELTPSDLEAEFKSMVEYGESPPDHVEVMNVLDEWPAKEPGDIGWAYVAISGGGWSEAVSVVVCQQAGRSVIRQIEWGRP